MSQAPLLSQVISENKKFFLQFGGQGAPWLKELTKLYQEPELKELFQNAFTVIDTEMKRVGNLPQFDLGYNLKSWLDNNETAPSEDYLARACISVPAIFLTQVGNYYLLSQKGYKPSELLAHTSAVTGHSQGVISACLIGLGKEGTDFQKAFSDFLKFAFYMGTRGQEIYPEWNTPQDIIDANLSNGDKAPSPMVAIIGYTKDELEDRVNKANSELNLTGLDKVYISLYNTPDSMIVSGKQSSLLKFRTKWKSEMDEKKIKFVYLKTTAAFHCPLMDMAWDNFSKNDIPYVELPYKGSDFKIPVFGIYQGDDMRSVTDLREKLFKMVLIEPLIWEKAIRSIWEDASVSTILDYGPSPVSQKLTGGHLKAREIEKVSYCASSPKDLKTILGTA